ncbi:hypothetical protein H0A71_22815 [Alcaligenaceae bacterium]|nr:hypothetical protein [Alcaligenaceae bacterium]
MSIEQVKIEIRRFLKEEDRLALCLSGKWGVGKTYTWETLLTEAFKNKAVSPTRYAYVSLFGLESLGDVRRSLFENTVESAAFKSMEPFEATTSSVSDRVSHFASKWRAGAGIIRGMPIIADYSSLAEKVGFLDVRDQIVCFDDLERLSDHLALKDVLGLISFLKEKKRCKVVLVLNNEALKEQDADDFKKQLEKIIDINLVFSPTAQEVAGIAISDAAAVHLQWVGEYTTTLGISNIRTIFKLLRIAGRLEEILNGYDERIIKQAIHSACLYGFALYQPTEAPPIKNITEKRSYAFFAGDKDERTPEEIQWSELLSAYGYQSADAFDVAIFDSMRRGFYDEIRIKREADVLAQQRSLHDQDAAFSKAWSIYHDSFDDNAVEFAAELRRSIIDYAAAISPRNLSASIKTLKQLGYGDDIEDLIIGYIEKRNDGKEFWSTDPFMPTFDIEDPDVAAAFARKAAEFNDNPKLQNVLADIVRNKGWGEGMLEFIDKHSADDFYAILKATKGKELRRVVYGLTYFRRIANADETMQSITEKAISALQRIGAESLINRLRVEKFGITFSETA